LPAKTKVKVKIKVAGFRPGRRLPFGLPPKRKQKPAGLTPDFLIY
jgi:hypothetical protein